MSNKSHVVFPPHFKHAAALPCKMQSATRSLRRCQTCSINQAMRSICTAPPSES